MGGEFGRNGKDKKRRSSLGLSFFILPPPLSPLSLFVFLYPLPKKLRSVTHGTNRNLPFSFPLPPPLSPLCLLLSPTPLLRKPRYSGYKQKPFPLCSPSSPSPLSLLSALFLLENLVAYGTDQNFPFLFHIPPSQSTLSFIVSSPLRNT